MQCPNCSSENIFKTWYPDHIACNCVSCNNTWDAYLLTPAHIEAVELDIQAHDDFEGPANIMGTAQAMCNLKIASQLMRDTFADALKGETK